MNWDSIKAFIDSITNNPTFITLVGILTASIPLLTIFKNSSYGKKAIRKLTNLYNLGVSRANETLKKVEDVEKLAKEKIEALKGYYEEKAEELKNQCEQKVACAISFVNYYEDGVFAILEKIPNAKVQNEVKAFKEQYKEKKKEISETIGDIYEDYQLALKEKEDEIRKDYDSKVAYLENQINETKLFIAELKEAKEDGKREENEDSNPEEENIQEN